MLWTVFEFTTTTAVAGKSNAAQYSLASILYLVCIVSTILTSPAKRKLDTRQKKTGAASRSCAFSLPQKHINARTAKVVAPDSREDGRPCCFCSPPHFHKDAQKTQKKQNRKSGSRSMRRPTQKGRNTSGHHKPRRPRNKVCTYVEKF